MSTVTVTYILLVYWVLIICITVYFSTADL